MSELHELREFAAKLLATACKLPPGQDRYNALREIGKFRARIAALERQAMRLLTISVVTLLTLAGVTSARALTCTEAAAQCRGSAGAGKTQIAGDCESARTSCLKTGVFVGPSSGKMWQGLKKRQPRSAGDTESPQPQHLGDCRACRTAL